MNYLALAMVAANVTFFAGIGKREGSPWIGALVGVAATGVWAGLFDGGILSLVLTDLVALAVLTGVNIARSRL
jgi:hypothetical protein